MSRGIVTRNGKLTVSESVVRANREHDRRMEAGELCAACGNAFGTYVPSYKQVITKDAQDPACCNVCAPDFR